jgi:hypothetical protein
MTDHVVTGLQESRWTFGSVCRVVVIASLAWAVGGSFDGADLDEHIAVPLLVAAWGGGIFILDRRREGPSLSITPARSPRMRAARFLYRVRE